MGIVFSFYIFLFWIIFNIYVLTRWQNVNDCGQICLLCLLLKDFLLLQQNIIFLFSLYKKYFSHIILLDYTFPSFVSPSSSPYALPSRNTHFLSLIRQKQASKHNNKIKTNKLELDKMSKQKKNSPRKVTRNRCRHREPLIQTLRNPMKL